jgi:hypothetical protein
MVVITYSGTVVGKLEGEREITLGFVDLMRDDYIEKTVVVVFTLHKWVSLRCNASSWWYSAFTYCQL